MHDFRKSESVDFRNDAVIRVKVTGWFLEVLNARLFLNLGNSD